MAGMRKSPKSWKKSGSAQGGYDAGKNQAYYGSGSPQDNPTVPRHAQQPLSKPVGHVQQSSKKGYVVGADTMRVNPKKPKTKKEIFEEGWGKSKQRVNEVRERGTHVIGDFGAMFPMPPMSEMRMPSGMGNIGMGFAPPANWMMGPFGNIGMGKQEGPVRKKKSKKQRREPRERESSLSDMMAMPESARRWMM